MANGSDLAPHRELSSKFYAGNKRRQELTSRTLSNLFPPCGLAVATATDSMVYKSDVIAASRLPSDGWTDEKKKQNTKAGKTTAWGSKAVLVLIGVRLGLDGVNPIYHESIKVSLMVLKKDGV